MKKNILFVVPTMDSGGVEAGVVELAKYNNESNDFNMFVLTSGGNLISKLKMYGVNCILLNVKTKNLFKIYKNIKNIEKIIRENKIDIVQVESRAPAWSCYYACKHLNIPTITTIHGIYGSKCGPFGIFSFFKKWYNSIMFRSSAVICVSNYVYDYVMNNYKKYIRKKNFVGKIEVIHRGIDTNIYNKNNISVNRILAVQKELNLPEDKAVIAVPGRFSEQKGQDYFLRVLKYLKSTNYVCVLVGDINKKPKYVKYLKKLIYKYNLQDRVQIHGNIADIQALYYISSVVISSSVKPESFGRISIEAQAMEKLFVGTALGGTLETVVDKKTGFLVPENNEKVFADVVDDVLKFDDDKKNKITDYAKKNVMKNFSFEKYYNNVIELYKNIEIL